jgi:hypothetical protein
MLEQTISKWFAKNKWTWNLKTGAKIPSEEDVEQALDEAARVLYNEHDGTQLEVGRLIIKKKPNGHDVYMYVGEYI